MALALGQEVKADDAGASGTTVTTPAFGTAVTIGSGIVVWTTCFDNNTPPGILTDTASQVYLPVVASAFDSLAGDQALQVYYLPNNQSHTTLALHLTYGTSQTFKGIWAQEVTGVGTGASDNATAAITVFPGTGTDAISTAAILPSGPGRILCVSLAMDILNGDGTGINPGTSWSIGTRGWGFGGNNLAMSQSRVLTTAASIAATATDATESSTFAIGMIMLDEAVAPPANSNRFISMNQYRPKQFRV